MSPRVARDKPPSSEHAWLVDELRSVPRELIPRAYEIYDSLITRYPKQKGLRDEVMLAVIAALSGQANVNNAGTMLHSARLELDRAMAIAVQLAIMAVEDGMSKTEAARRAQVDRMTLLRAMGER